ncbi:hypothetical protein [Shewanella sp. NIFS-20-20]|uniref:hypothetical protein n=1 Tax=Shewanella sp. NIFS-20-20 TaxID=2853806 RepID=UPI001C443DF3|nr:hypothetical protein [Shewanella sp. NIFS-20-20]MBV7317287.1 hypothetical protein [Shewanella sp. NIFS-20-20]
MKAMTTNVLVSLAVCFSVTAFAHEEPIEGRWCSGGQIKVLGEFSIMPLHLSRFARNEEPTCEPVNGDINTRSCGQFDDEYGVARMAAAQLCHTLAYSDARTSIDADDGSVKPIFYGPESLRNTQENHHEVYTIQQGVNFACGLCEMEVSRRQRSLSVK